MPRRSRLRKLFRMLLLGVVLPLVAAWIGYRLVSDYLVTVEDRNARRDPVTGWRVGMGERTVGPEDSAGAVLMVHGFVGGWNNFHELPDRLAAKGWRVRMMRLPGHGTSPRDYEVVTVDEMLAAVREELEALKEEHESVVLVGHSLGGALATLAVSRDGADKLVLGAPYFGVTHRWYYGLRPETWTRLLSPLLRWVYKGELFLQVNRKEAKPEIETYQWVPTKGLLTLQEAGRRANEQSVLERVQCPVLVVHSSGDLAAGIAQTRAAVDRMGAEEKEYLWLERSNHHVFWDWDREEVHARIEAFLGEPPTHQE